MSAAHFTFGLESVRGLRVHAEDRAKEELAQSLAARGRGEAELRAADARLRSSMDLQRDQVVAAPLSGAALFAQQAWTERMERSIADKQRELQRHDVAVAARRTALGTAARDREVLDRLKARKLDEHRVIAQRVEDAATDEMAARSHARRTAA